MGIKRRSKNQKNRIIAVVDLTESDDQDDEAKRVKSDFCETPKLKLRHSNNLEKGRVSKKKQKGKAKKRKAQEVENVQSVENFLKISSCSTSSLEISSDKSNVNEVHEKVNIELDTKDENSLDTYEERDDVTFSKMEDTLCEKEMSAIFTKYEDATRFKSAAITSREKSIPEIELKQDECNIETTVGLDIIQISKTEPNDWHVCNMKFVLEKILNHPHYKDLFTSEQLNFFKSLDEVGSTERKLCVRLLFRKHKWFRLDQLMVDKKLNLNITTNQADSIYDKLFILKLILTDYSRESVLDLLNQLNLNEIKKIVVLFKLPSSKETKQSMIKNILDYSKRQKTLFSSNSQSLLVQKISRVLGKCLILNPTFRAALLRAQYLFSITESLDLPSELHSVLSLLNIQSDSNYRLFEKVDTPKLFNNIDEFVEYETFYKQRRQRLELKASKPDERWLLVQMTLQAYIRFEEYLSCPKYLSAHQQALDSSHLKRFSLGECLVRLINEGIIDLKQTVKSYIKSELVPEYVHEIVTSCFKTEIFSYNELLTILSTLLAQPYYGKSKRGEWYKHMALLVQEHYKDPTKTADVYLTALNNEELSAVDRYNLSKSLDLIIRTKKNLSVEFLEKIPATFPVLNESFSSITINAIALSGNAPGLKRTYKYQDEYSTTYGTVEEIAISYYKRHDFTDGCHCEGQAVVQLFGLLFSDIIYKHYVPNTFISYIQTVPLDMYSRSFYINRKQVIDDRLVEISEWSKETLKKVILDQVAVLESKNTFLTGFNNILYVVDILVQRLELSILIKILERLAKEFGMASAGFPDIIIWNDSEVRFVEVKGQNDKLSAKQVFWLEFLQSIGAGAEVCYVHTIGSREVRQQSMNRTVKSINEDS